MTIFKSTQTCVVVIPIMITYSMLPQLIAIKYVFLTCFTCGHTLLSANTNLEHIIISAYVFFSDYNCPPWEHMVYLFCLIIVQPPASQQRIALYMDI